MPELVPTTSASRLSSTLLCLVASENQGRMRRLHRRFSITSSVVASKPAASITSVRTATPISTTLVARSRARKTRTSTQGKRSAVRGTSKSRCGSLFDGTTVDSSERRVTEASHLQEAT